MKDKNLKTLNKNVDVLFDNQKQRTEELKKAFESTEKARMRIWKTLVEFENINNKNLKHIDSCIKFFLNFTDEVEKVISHNNSISKENSDILNKNFKDTDKFVNELDDRLLKLEVKISQQGH